MKRHSTSGLFWAALSLASLTSIATAADSPNLKFGPTGAATQTQTPLTLTCAVTAPGPNTQFSPYCVPTHAASSYTITFRITGGSSNQSYVWQAPTPNSCTSTTSACTYQRRAVAADLEGVATATVTDLNTGAVTQLSAQYFIPATCGGPGGGYVYC